MNYRSFIPAVLLSLITVSPLVGAATPEARVLRAASAEDVIRLDQRLRKVEGIVARLERIVDNQALVNMLLRLDAMQADVGNLRGDVEVQTHDMEGIERRQRELYVDLDRRLQQIEKQLVALKDAMAKNQGPTQAAPGVAVSPSGPQSPLGSAPSAQLNTSPAVVPPSGQQAPGALSPAPVTAFDPAQERRAYHSAFETLRKGQWEQAIAEFSAFLQKFPKGEYAGNGQYWLGEAKYVTRRFEESIEEFNKVLTLYPNSSKAPDAMLKIGFANYELAQWPNARQVLEDLVKRFPGSTASRLADDRLQRMTAEGH